MVPSLGPVDGFLKHVRYFICVLVVQIPNPLKLESPYGHVYYQVIALLFINFSQAAIFLITRTENRCIFSKCNARVMPLGDTVFMHVGDWKPSWERLTSPRTGHEQSICDPLFHSFLVSSQLEHVFMDKKKCRCFYSFWNQYIFALFSFLQVISNKAVELLRGDNDRKSNPGPKVHVVSSVIFERLFP